MPGYEPDYTKPDPEGDTAGTLVLALTNDDSTHNHPKELNMKPKLEPEPMMIEAAAPLDSSRRSRRSARRSESPATVDPSVGVEDDFVEPQPVLYGTSGDDMDNDGEEEEYDQYGFRKSQPQIYVPKRLNNRTEEYKRPEELEESLSFTTEDPEEEKRRSKKSSSKKHKKKHKKKKRRSSSSDSRQKYEENSTLESSERYKSYARRESGVESLVSEVGSLDLESSASYNC